MTKRDDITYGFNRDDADSLIQMIGGGDVEFPEVRPRGGGAKGKGRVAKNGSSAISARDGTTVYGGNVTLQERSSSTLSDGTTVFAYNLLRCKIAANDYIFVQQDQTGTYWIVEHSSPRLFRFTLTSDMATSATANLAEMDGTSAGSGTVLDPLDIFDELVSTDVGICLFQDNAYYVIQAKC